MGRAQRKTPRRDPGDWVANLVADLIPGAELAGGGGEGQRREEGIGEPRDIPGGLNHRANPPVEHEKAPFKDPGWQYRRANLAHGVPPDEAGYYERDPRLSNNQHGGGHAALHHEVSRPSPVPVYLVEGEEGGRVRREVALRSITCPASTAAEPARVCGRNESRVEIRLLNEDTATDIRFAPTLAALAAGTGALLPWPGNTYLALPGQGELFAIGATGAGTPRLSIIETYEQAAG